MEAEASVEGQPAQGYKIFGVITVYGILYKETNLIFVDDFFIEV